MDKYIEEWMDALKWARDEEKLVKERLRREGRLQPGLDTNREDYKYINDELKRRAEDIRARAEQEG